ncbi:MAG: hypothetical protein IIA09_13345 [Proteobacteria bacterium]|nr:hypothetical protein [Pseudomonadota bacterium]
MSFPDKQLGIEAQKVRTVPGYRSWWYSHRDIAMSVSAPVQLPAITQSLSCRKTNVAAAVLRDITDYTSTNNATADDDNMHVSLKFVRPFA